MIQLGQNFAHVKTAQLSRHVHIYDIVRSQQAWKKQKELLQYFIYKRVNPLWHRSLVLVSAGHDAAI